ncbi:hypothetical protein NC796_04750 [Aliifodinibius sp. S!AR15-10]|uniref:hypothetical protein n=1 Tax=Aliifodinibius sp. S!AR15-10 TaxID=2950437 RepID=UPI002865D9ED|nr:hypothetical protein [Aliifodinibius sp. S!AR15-10]MDR8390440.1 hypothetical protein [Aliifodinibius sp. S!AR15-10]
MKLKMKLRKKFKFAATTLLFLFGGHTKEAHSQNTAHAVMKVSVRIVSNPQIDSNIITDISDQLQTGKKQLSLGGYSMDIPTGRHYTFDFNPQIKMQNDADSWDISTDVLQSEKDGKITYNFTGKASTSSIPPGNYSGELSTTIEYM